MDLPRLVAAILAFLHGGLVEVDRDVALHTDTAHVRHAQHAMDGVESSGQPSFPVVGLRLRP